MLKVENTVSRGNRLITTSAISKGTVFHKITDYQLMGQATYQTVQVDTAMHLEEYYLSHTNHSCAPNIVIDITRLECRALRDIEPGEELSFFYPSTEWSMNQPFVCNCGSAHCIQLVEGAKTLSLNVLGKQFINPHIRRQALQCLEEKVLGHTVQEESHRQEEPYRSPAARQSLSFSIISK
jgi:hypothetical protein